MHSEIVEMINKALQAMLVGIPGVFLVLAVFYFVLKLLMLRTKRRHTLSHIQAQAQAQAEAFAQAQVLEDNHLP